MIGLLTISLFANAIFPKKHICLDQVSFEPMTPVDLKEMFDSCINKCSKDNSTCLKQCVDLTEMMYERLYYGEEGQD
jgi:hypothetical protein